MVKRRLMTPGPTDVPEGARLAMAQQVMHHRTPEFRAVLAEVLDGLKYVFQTSSDVVLLSASGTGAMEAAMVNLVPRGGKAIVLEAGVFARRWADIARVFGIEVVLHSVPWGQTFDLAAVKALLAEHPDAVAVFATLMESSTGVAHDIEALGKIVRGSNSLLVVDGISGVGAVECRTDDWGVDVLVVGSQKALMMPPGLAFLSVSPRAWQQVERIEPQAFYFNLKYHRSKLSGPDTPWTPAITLVVGLAETLRLIRATGIENVWHSTELLGRAVRGRRAGPGLRAIRRAAGGRNDYRQDAGGGEDRPGVAAAPGRTIRHQAGRRPGSAEGADLSDRPFWIGRPDRRAGGLGGAGTEPGRTGGTGHAGLGPKRGGRSVPKCGPGRQMTSIRLAF